MIIWFNFSPVMIKSYLKILIYTKRLRLPTLPKSILVNDMVVEVHSGYWLWTGLEDGSNEWHCKVHSSHWYYNVYYYALYANHKLCTFMLKSSPYICRYRIASMSTLWAKCNLSDLHLSHEFLNTFDLCFSSFQRMENVFVYILFQ